MHGSYLNSDAAKFWSSSKPWGNVYKKFDQSQISASLMSFVKLRCKYVKKTTCTI